jgi:integrase
VGLAEEGRWAPKTLNNALTAMVVCLNHAVAEGLINSNPASFVQALPAEHLERDYLRMHEIAAYLEACDDPYRPLAETLIGSGLRISEALALRVDDIVLEKGALIVYRSAQGGGQVGHTKGRRFRRVEIGPGLAGVLRDVLAQRPNDPSALVFVMPHRTTRGGMGHWDPARAGEPIDRSTVSRGWHKEALQDGGLRDMPLHALRHTAAAAWLATGHPLVYVQRQLGHSQITTTERVYGHLEETFMRSAAADTEQAIARASALHIQ